VAWSVCAFAGVRVAVLLRGALGMLSWYLRNLNGTRRVIKGSRRGTQAAVSRCTLASVERSYRLMGGL
jgi:hypothetical protein